MKVVNEKARDLRRRFEEANPSKCPEEGCPVRCPEGKFCHRHRKQRG